MPGRFSLMAKRDYYEILGLTRGAADADIKKAYRKLAKEFHPDHNKGKEAEERFKEVQEAYGVLSNPDKRARYDQFGHAGVDPRFQAGGGGTHWSTADGTTFDFDSIADMFDFGSARGGVGSVFEQFLRGRGGRVHTAEPPPAAGDVEHPATLSFEQMMSGTTLSLEMSLGGRKSETIDVRIPAGVREGQRIRVRGKGQPGMRGGAPGDLYVVCHVEPHRHFERVGSDLLLVVPVTIVEASLGAKIDIPTPDGVRTVTLPPGTASGAKLRLGGLGAPNPKDGARGDLFAVVKIVPPEKVTAEQKELLAKLGETIRTSPRDGRWD